MGNRGILHNDQKQIVRQRAGIAWVTCLLEYKGIKRKEIFGKGHYSELFFLDEATAFAAGHRPCAHCQRERFNEFKSAWLRANPPGTADSVGINYIDRRLHAERVRRGGEKVVYTAPLRSLPAGTFIDLAGRAVLIGDDALREWSPEGYTTDGSTIDADRDVTVLTPSSVVRMFSRGFRPLVYGEPGYPDQVALPARSQPLACSTQNV
jgi:hypothetical protein